MLQVLQVYRCYRCTGVQVLQVYRCTGVQVCRDLVQQVVGADLQRLDLSEQFHVLNFIFRDNLEAVLIVISEDNTSSEPSVTPHRCFCYPQKN